MSSEKNNKTMAFASNCLAAGKTWMALPTLELSVAGKLSLSLSSQYRGLSLVAKKQAFSLLQQVVLSEDAGLEPTPQQVQAIAKVAQELGGYILVTQGGGISITSYALLKALSMLFHKSVHLKAYGSSLLGTPVIKDINLSAKFGYIVGHTGRTINGKPEVVRIESEGDHMIDMDVFHSWGFWDKDPEVGQFRATDLCWSRGVLEPVIDAGRKIREEIIAAGKTVGLIARIWCSTKSKDPNPIPFSQWAKIRQGKSWKPWATNIPIPAQAKFPYAVWDMVAGFYSDSKVVDWNNAKRHWAKANPAKLPGFEFGLKEWRYLLDILTQLNQDDPKLLGSLLAKELGVEDMEKKQMESVKAPHLPPRNLGGMELEANVGCFMKGIVVPYSGILQQHGVDVIIDSKELKGNCKELGKKLQAEHFEANFISADKNAEIKHFEVATCGNAFQINFGLMKCFKGSIPAKRSKVRMSPQLLEKWPTLLHPEISSSNRKEKGITACRNTSEKFVQYFSKRKDKIKELVTRIRKGKSPSSTEFIRREEWCWDAPDLPQQLFKLMLDCKVRYEFEAKGGIDKLLGTIGSGRDAELANLYEEIGLDKLLIPNAVETVRGSWNKKVSEFLRGGGVRGENLVAIHNEICPRGYVILPVWMRESTSDDGSSNRAIVWRYPISCPTSVGGMLGIWADDPVVKEALESLGYHSNTHAVIINPEDGKFLYIGDSDGDCYGILIEKSKGNPMEQLESIIMIGLGILRRPDFARVEVEIPPVESIKTKDRTITKNGEVSDFFKKISPLDLRGPVGPATDMATVAYAAGLKGEMFKRFMAVASCLVQHSVDSPKHSMLVVPPLVLEKSFSVRHVGAGETWYVSEEKLKQLLEWHNKWGEWAKTCDFANFPETAAWLPQGFEIFNEIKKGNFWNLIPASLLKRIGEEGSVYKPVHSKLFDCVVTPEVASYTDENLYSFQHVVKYCQHYFEDGWDSYAPFRSADWSTITNHKVIVNEELGYTSLVWPWGPEQSYWNDFKGSSEENLFPLISMKLCGKWALETWYEASLDEISKHAKGHKSLPVDRFAAKPAGQLLFDIRSKLFAYGLRAAGVPESKISEAVQHRVNRQNSNFEWIDGIYTTKNTHKYYSERKIDFDYRQSGSKAINPWIKWLLYKETELPKDDTKWKKMPLALIGFDSLLKHFLDCSEYNAIHQAVNGAVRKRGRIPQWGRKTLEYTTISVDGIVSIDDYGSCNFLEYDIPSQFATDGNCGLLLMEEQSFIVRYILSLVLRKVLSLTEGKYLPCSFMYDVQKGGKPKFSSKTELTNLIVKDWNPDHIKMVKDEDGEPVAITQCPHCVKAIRELVVKATRKEITDRLKSQAVSWLYSLQNVLTRAAHIAANSSLYGSIEGAVLAMDHPSALFILRAVVAATDSTSNKEFFGIYKDNEEWQELQKLWEGLSEKDKERPEVREAYMQLDLVRLVTVLSK